MEVQQEKQEENAQALVTSKEELEDSDALVTPLGARVEYRDEHGNILDEDLVKELDSEGKVTFSTRYETRTRRVDPAGNVVHDGLVEEEEEGYAGTIADGSNPETAAAGQEAVSEQPANVKNVEDDVSKERSIDEAPPSAEPASDANTATGKDEL